MPARKRSKSAKKSPLEQAIEIAPPASKRLTVLGQPATTAERADAARNRIAILEAARRLLKKRPIGEICMDELAEAAGVGKGTLYRRFEDRSSLCRALLHDAAIELQTRVLRGFDLPKSASWIERLDRLLTAIFEFNTENASLLSEAAAFERRGAARYDHPAHAWQRQEIALHLKKAAASGEVDPLDPEVTADFVIAALDPDLIAWHMAHGTSPASLKASFRRLWQSGILCRRS